jgi:hypothetical protein
MLLVGRRRPPPVMLTALEVVDPAREEPLRTVKQYSQHFSAYPEIMLPAGSDVENEAEALAERKMEQAIGADAEKAAETGAEQVVEKAALTGEEANAFRATMQDEASNMMTKTIREMMEETEGKATEAAVRERLAQNMSDPEWLKENYPNIKDHLEPKGPAAGGEGSGATADELERTAKGDPPYEQEPAAPGAGQPTDPAAAASDAGVEPANPAESLDSDTAGGGEELVDHPPDAEEAAAQADKLSKGDEDLDNNRNSSTQKWEQVKKFDWAGLVKTLVVMGLAAFAAIELLKAWGALKNGCYGTSPTDGSTVQVTSGKNATCPPSYQCHACSAPPSTDAPVCPSPVPTQATCTAGKTWSAVQGVYEAPCGGKLNMKPATFDKHTYGTGCCCGAVQACAEVADSGDSGSGPPKDCHFCISKTKNSDGLYPPLADNQEQDTCEQNQGFWTAGYFQDCNITWNHPKTYSCAVGDILNNAEKLAAQAWKAGIGLATAAAGAAAWLMHHLGIILGGAGGGIVLIIIIVVAVKYSKKKQQQQQQQQYPQQYPQQQGVQMMNRLPGASVAQAIAAVGG